MFYSVQSPPCTLDPFAFVDWKMILLVAVGGRMAPACRLGLVLADTVDERTIPRAPAVKNTTAQICTIYCSNQYWQYHLALPGLT